MILQIAGPTGILLCKILCRLLKKSYCLFIMLIMLRVIFKVTFLKILLSIPRSRNFFMINYAYFQERIATKCCEFILAVSDNNKERFIAKYKISPQKTRLFHQEPIYIYLLNLINA